LSGYRSVKDANNSAHAPVNRSHTLESNIGAIKKKHEEPRRRGLWPSAKMQKAHREVSLLACSKAFCQALA